MGAGRYFGRRVGHRPGARLVAWGALLSGLAGAALIVWGIIDTPLLALLMVVFAVAFLALVFVALTSDGMRRRGALAAALVLVLGLIAIHVAWNATHEGWQLKGLTGLVLVVLAGVAARYALVIPPPSIDEVLTVTDERLTLRRPVLIINLKSGGGKAQQFDLVELCREHGIETRVLEPGVQLTDLAVDAVRNGADALGMAGGDGSLGYVATVAAAHGLPFVCVPAGTRNHFALDLGLDRNDPRQALAAFVNGDERTIDYATVNGRMFLNNVSLGVYAAIVAQDSYRDAKLDTTLQLLPKLVQEGGPWFDLHFDVPEHGRLDQAALLQVSNNPYVVGADFGRRGRLDAGELGIMTADPQRLADLVGLTMLAAAGKAERASALWVWSAPSFVVESGQAHLDAGLDGETVSLDTPLRFGMAPAGLRVLVPHGTRVGLDEQTVDAKGTLSGLLSVALGLDAASETDPVGRDD